LPWLEAYVAPRRGPPAAPICTPGPGVYPDGDGPEVGATVAEALLDEESGQWLKLPTRTTNSMRTAGHTRAVLLPATLAQSTALAANH
jgi:hypothetical protein